MKFVTVSLVYGESMLAKLINIVYPPTCLHCQKPVSTLDTLCYNCYTKISHADTNTCQICGDKKYGLYDLCKHCITHKPYFKKILYLYDYGKIVKKLVFNLKYNDKPEIAYFLAKNLYEVHKNQIVSADLITSIPLHYIKLVTRKYNQSALIATSIAKLASINTDFTILKRIKHNKAQAKISSRIMRINNIKDCFAINEKKQNVIKGKKIILIDDVVTTAATVNECAKILVNSGAKEVIVLAITRVKF